MSIPKRKRGRPVNPKAEYRALADRLREDLVSGRWKNQDVFPSIRSLAKDFAIGVDTARQAVEQLKSEGRLAVNAHRRLVVLSGKRPDPEMTNKGIVLEVLGAPMDKFHHNCELSDLQRGIEQGCGEIQAPLLIAHAFHLRTSLPHGFMDLALQAILVVGHCRKEVFEQYEKLPIPVVVTDQPAPVRGLHNVCVDNEAIVCDATRRLIELGHRQIAFVRYVLLSVSDIDPDSKERERGYAKALRDAGLRREKSWTVNVLPGDRSDSAALQTLADPASGITAAVCVDPTRARMVAEAAKKAGRRIPEDLSIVSVMGTSNALPFSGPTVDFVELGRQAALAANRAKRSHQRIRIGAAWRDRGTVAPPPAS